MNKVTITKASKLAKVSRSHFYKKYIKTGVLTVDRSNPDKPLIDVSELLRVFGELHEDNTPIQENNTSSHTSERTNNTEYTLHYREEIARLKAENEGLKALVQAKNEQVERERAIADREKLRVEQAEKHYHGLIEFKSSRRKSILHKVKTFFQN